MLKRLVLLLNLLLEPMVFLITTINSCLLQPDSFHLLPLADRSAFLTRLLQSLHQDHLVLTRLHRIINLVKAGRGSRLCPAAKVLLDDYTVVLSCFHMLSWCIDSH